MFRNEAERARARKWGIADLDRIFAATGVTDGLLLAGVKRRLGGTMTTERVVMRASTGTMRWVRTEHRIG